MIEKIFRNETEFSNELVYSTKKDLDKNFNAIVQKINVIIDEIENINNNLLVEIDIKDYNKNKFFYYDEKNKKNFSKVTNSFIENNSILGSKILEGSINLTKLNINELKNFLKILQPQQQKEINIKELQNNLQKEIQQKIKNFLENSKENDITQKENEENFKNINIKLKNIEKKIKNKKEEIDLKNFFVTDKMLSNYNLTFLNKKVSVLAELQKEKFDEYIDNKINKNIKENKKIEQQTLAGGVIIGDLDRCKNLSTITLASEKIFFTNEKIIFIEPYYKDQNKKIISHYFLAKIKYDNDIFKKTDITNFLKSEKEIQLNRKKVAVSVRAQISGENITNFTCSLNDFLFSIGQENTFYCDYENEPPLFFGPVVLNTKDLFLIKDKNNYTTFNLCFNFQKQNNFTEQLITIPTNYFQIQFFFNCVFF